METENGTGWAVAASMGLAPSPGFRKIRAPAGRDGVRRQRDRPASGLRDAPASPRAPAGALHRARRATIEITLGGETRTLGPGGLARVDAGTVRNLRNLSSEREATYVCVGGAGGYVGRDGVSDA